MARKKEKGDVLNPYALDRVTGHFVIPNASGRVDEDGIVEFYDPEKHKGHLTCPKCEKPNLHFKPERPTAGDKKTRRDHFARNAGEDHDLFCEVGIMALEYPSQDRVIDHEKAPYVYMNASNLTKRPPYKSVFNKAAAYIPQKSLSLIPTWLKAITYTKNNHDFDSIGNADFKDRPRLNPITSVKDFIRVIKTLTPQKLQDTWVINNGVAVKISNMIVRAGQKSMLRSDDDMQASRENAGLPTKFLMARDGQFDRFAALLHTEQLDIKYPVLLHFKVEHAPKYMEQGKDRRMRIDLPKFMVENPFRKSNTPARLALPEVAVVPYVHIKDPAIFASIKEGDEFFAIAHPYLFKDDGLNGAYRQHFDILRPCDIIKMTQQELADDIKKAAKAREAHALRKAEKAKSPTSAPTSDPAPIPA